MTERKATRLIAIPAHWTPEQADAVFTFLARLADAVFLAYEEPLCRIGYLDALGHAEHDIHPDDDPDEPFPF
jgi:hypothetical protein